MAFPPVPPLPKLSLHKDTVREQIEPVKIVDWWLSSLEKSFECQHTADISVLFINDCWWRDLVALSWDIRTKAGQASVAKYLKESTSAIRQIKSIKDGGLQPNLMDMGGLIWIESGFTFETKYGYCRGIVRLANVGPKEWKAWTVFTQLEKLNGQDELEKSRAREPLKSTRFSNEETSSNEDLQVLIIGAGQSGLALGAELKNMGLKTLIVDKASRIGDGWRKRYDTVTTHSPTYADHYPFLKYPENWPSWLHRDKITSWMDHYAQIMGLDIKLNSNVKNIKYDQKKRHYRVEIDGSQTLTPRHLVLATGLFSNIPNYPEFHNQRTFRGHVYHSTDHKSAAQIPQVRNRKVSVIGAGTTAHDIAQDFVNCGAKEVSMIQHGPIFSLSSDSAEKAFFSPYKTLPTDIADMMSNSFPTPVKRTLGLGMTHMMAENDKTLLIGLEKAGLAVKRGEDGNSFIDYMLFKFGHFYIDQGASQMIIDGRIKIQRCEEGVQEFSPEGVVLADGVKVEADVVVLATGVQFGTVVVENIIGKDFVDKLGGLGSLDEEGERLGWWRPTKSPGFWYMPGTFQWARQFSRILALQINAIEKGFNDGYYKAYDTLALR